MDKADKFAWKFLIEEGNVFTDWSYYGGGYEKSEKLTKECLAKIKTVGIDWNKTHPIHEESHSSFTDTFHDPEYIATMEGTLYLNDGSKYNWGIDNVNLGDITKKLFSSLVDQILVDPFEN